MLNLDYIKEFVTFAQYLSVTKAAEALFTSKSTLSKHIRQLETETGFHLVDRSTAEFHLTQEGEVFYNAFSSMLAEYDDAESKCRALRRQSHETLYVQEPSYQDTSALALFGLIAEIKAINPTLPIRYRRPQRRDLLSDLQEKKLDIAIIHVAKNDTLPDGSEQGERIKYYPLAEDALTIWCHKSHRFANMSEVPIEEMANATMLTANDFYSPLRDILQAYCNEHGVKLRFRVIESENPTTFLTSQYPREVYVIPKSAEGDLRVKGRKEMVFVPLERDRIQYKCYAVMLESRVGEFFGIDKLFS